MTNLLKIACCSLVLGLASPAFAEGPQAPPPPPPDGTQQPPNDGQQPNNGQVMGQPGDQQQQQQGPVMGAPQQEQSAHDQAQQGRGLEYGAYAYVPIFIGQPQLGAGLGIQGRVGWEFGSGFTAEVQGGAAYNFVSGLPGFADSGLTNLWIGAGMRYAFLNPSPAVPFVGAGLNIGFWDETVGSIVNNVNFGFSLLAGLAYEISADIALEAGVQFWGTSGTTSLFNDAFAFGISPYVGATLYYN